MSHEVVKNHEIELLKESLSGGGGVVARKTVGESLGIFFSSCLVRTNDTPQALPFCRLAIRFLKGFRIAVLSSA